MREDCVCCFFVAGCCWWCCWCFWGLFELDWPFGVLTAAEGVCFLASLVFEVDVESTIFCREFKLYFKFLVRKYKLCSFFFYFSFAKLFLNLGRTFVIYCEILFWNVCLFPECMNDSLCGDCLLLKNFQSRSKRFNFLYSIIFETKFEFSELNSNIVFNTIGLRKLT